ncbi:MAG: hypothetical protein ACLP1Y_09000 [Candidatus Acidiferrales bacterium]
MKTTFTKWIPAAIALCLAVMVAIGYGQTTMPAPAGPPDQNGNAMYRGGMVEFVGAEAMLGDRLVTGAPFTADIVNEFTQTLSDGTRIDRKTTGSIARDSQGRTRREMTPPAIGPFATSGAPTIILINDPVAHKHYALNPKDKTARELGQALRLGAMGRDGHGAGGPGGQDGRDGRNGFAERGAAGRGRDGGAGGRRGGEPVTVSLGTKTIDGVTVEGTRTTRTIPAGTIGNEKAIEIVFERWYSPDLLTDVMTRRSNPFSGETVFQLTNIKRAEPAASLFQVPSDYKLQSGRPGFGGQAGRRMEPGMRHGGPNGNAPNSNSNPAPPPPPSDPPAPGQGQDN